MIDTVGHSQKNIKQIKKLQETFDFNPIIENHLVLSCSTKEQDQFDIINTFDILKIDSLIFTKTDETNELGSIFNISAKTGKPISYITNGQNVPEDIIKATKENVVALIFNEDAVSQCSGAIHRT
jgi:flagellar biosynthesis protein FlhF